MKRSIPKVLLCDDDALIHLSLKQALKEEFQIRGGYSLQEALVLTQKESFDVALIDMGLNSQDEGLQLISELRRIDDGLPIVVFSGRTDLPLVKKALKLGAVDYLAKDASVDDLLHTLRQAIEHRRLKTIGKRHDLEISHVNEKHPFLGQSAVIEKLRQTLNRIRDLDANVVITGETGTGKEVAARQLRRREESGNWAPFVSVDSATIQKSTAESTLFGYERGAFTGADKQTIGLFEEANGGVIYFDEISNMPLEIQAKLLRVLQEKEITRLGSTKTIPLEFRVICATNRSLDELVAEGIFKHDLLQRLNVIPISIPPLRERLEDLPMLIEHFVTKHGKGRVTLEFDHSALETLHGYSWPGNIRELSNLIAFLLATSESQRISIKDLPEKFRGPSGSVSTNIKAAIDTDCSFYEHIQGYEKQFLAAAYARFGKNISKMSQTLKMDRSHLYAKLKQYDIHGHT